jgi:hypothetical protein
MGANTFMSFLVFHSSFRLPHSSFLSALTCSFCASHDSRITIHGFLFHCPKIILTQVQPLHYAVSIPTIKRLTNRRIEIRPRDHMSPHFHVVAADGRNCTVEIESLQVTGPVRAVEITAALQRARDNKERLMEEWKKWHP